MVEWLERVDHDIERTTQSMTIDWVAKVNPHRNPTSFFCCVGDDRLEMVDFDIGRTTQSIAIDLVAEVHRNPTSFFSITVVQVVEGELHYN
jgi:hypothetical protein